MSIISAKTIVDCDIPNKPFKDICPLRHNTGPIGHTYHSEAPTNAASLPQAACIRNRSHLLAFCRQVTASELIKSPDLQRRIFLRKKQPWFSQPAQLSRVHFYFVAAFQLHQAMQQACQASFLCHQTHWRTRAATTWSSLSFLLLAFSSALRSLSFSKGKKFSDFRKPCAEQLNSIPHCFPTLLPLPQEAPSQQQFSSRQYSSANTLTL